MSWWLTGVIARIVSSMGITGASGYFLWFITSYLIPYFTVHNRMDKESTKVKLCVASQVVSIVCGVLFLLAAIVTLGKQYPHPSVNPRRYPRHDGQGQRGCWQCLVYLCSMSTFAFAVITTVYTWPWWHSLEDRGEAYLTTNCRALAIYSLGIACLGVLTPPAVFFLNYAGFTEAG